MYAGNDCPELYFLSGLKNVTRDDGDSKPEELLQALQSNDLKLVVINESPFFPSARMSPAVRAAVEQRFPESQMRAYSTCIGDLSSRMARGKSTKTTAV